MIVIKLQGGLGNQLFQYAAGYALAKKKGVPLGIDLGWFTRNDLRQPLLLKFETTSCKLFQNFFPNKENPSDKKYPKKLRDRISPYYRRSVFVERKVNYDPKFFKARENVYLDGYWQSEKYIIEHYDYLRSFVLSYKPMVAQAYSSYEDFILKNKTVGIHVRRGDYLSPKNIKIHGVCSSSYYLSAIQYLRSKSGDLSLMVFSDDIDWCKENFSQFPEVKFVNVNEPDSISELILFSRCHSQIISNSSFSWWGAWINNNSEKIVIAPELWFTDPRLQSQTSDLLPSNWLKF